jgi:hypothetical protein
MRLLRQRRNARIRFGFISSRLLLRNQIIKARLRLEDVQQRYTLCAKRVKALAELEKPRGKLFHDAGYKLVKQRYHTELIGRLQED